MDSEAEEMGYAVKSAFILSLGDFVYNSILALGLIVIARFLGAEGYGIYSLSISVPLALYSFISLSLDSAITRYTKLYLVKGMYRSVVGVVKTSFLLKGLIGSIGTFICFSYSKSLSSIIINRPELYSYVMVVSIAVLLESLYTYLLSVFVGFGEVWRNTVLKIVYSISRTTIAVILLLAGLRILGALVAYVLGFTLSVAIGLAFLMLLVKRRSNVDISITDDNVSVLSIAKELIIYSLPLYASSLITSISSIYQTMLLARTLTDVEIGGYRALLNLQTLILVILGPITMALLPMYTSVSVKESKEEIAKVLIKSNKYTAIIVTPLTLLTMIFSKDLIYLLLGSNYIFTFQYVPLLFTPFLFVGFGSTAIPQLFNALGMTRLNLYTSIISMVLFIPTSYFLTMVLNLRLWGFLISNIVASIVSVITYNYFLATILKNSIGVKEVIPVYISSALAMIPPFILLYIPLPKPISLIRIALGGILYITFYLVFLVVLKAIDNHEVEFFENAFRTMPLANKIMRFLATIVKSMLRTISNN